MEDLEKLRTLAKWFDIYDKNTGEPKGQEVQQDLIRISNKLEKLQQEDKELREGLKRCFEVSQPIIDSLNMGEQYSNKWKSFIDTILKAEELLRK